MADGLRTIASRYGGRVIRVLVGLALVLGVPLGEPSASGLALPDNFTVPRDTKVVGAAVPLLARCCPEGEPHLSAAGWFALLRVAGRPIDTYRALRTSAKAHGVTLPPASSACRRLPAPEETGGGAKPDRGGSGTAATTVTTTTPTGSRPRPRLDPAYCSGHGTSADGRTYFSAASASCASGRCKRNGFMLIGFRSTRLPQQREPTLVNPAPGITRKHRDAVTGSRLLAATDESCNVSVRVVEGNPDRYWRRLEGSDGRTATARASLQGRRVRLRYTSGFDYDTSDAMITGHGLAKPVVVTQGCW